jgi:hypothetical protein
MVVSGIPVCSDAALMVDISAITTTFAFSRLV